jgi:hypothetical protein
VIPAAPGWYVVTPWTDSNGRITELHNDPVVAWRIGLFERGDKSTFQHVTPIIGDLHSEYDGEILRRPDNSLFIPLVREFTSDPDAITYLQEMEDAAAARKTLRANAR